MLLGMEAAAVHPRRTLRKFLFDDHYQSDSRHSHITIVIHTSMSVLKGLRSKCCQNTEKYKKIQKIPVKSRKIQKIQINS